MYSPPATDTDFFVKILLDKQSGLCYNAFIKYIITIYNHKADK